MSIHDYDRYYEIYHGDGSQSHRISSMEEVADQIHLAGLILIMGPAGSGKTTLARDIGHYVEADRWNTPFHPSNLEHAHKRCFEEAFRYLYNNVPIVVSNTFTTVKEIAPYMALACQFRVPLTVVRITSPVDVCKSHRPSIPRSVILKHRQNMTKWNVPQAIKTYYRMESK